MADLTSRFTIIEVDNPHFTPDQPSRNPWRKTARVFQLCFDGKPLDGELCMTREEAPARIEFLAEAALTAKWLATPEND